MKRNRLILVLAAAAAVIALVVVGRGGGDGGGSEEAPEGSIAVSFMYSPEKEDLLEPLIEEFDGS